MATSTTLIEQIGQAGGISLMYLIELLVIGSVNHAYAWVFFAKEHCTAMVLRVFSPMPQRISRE
jgi:hypothetical protein